VKDSGNSNQTQSSNSTSAGGNSNQTQSSNSTSAGGTATSTSSGGAGGAGGSSNQKQKVENAGNNTGTATVTVQGDTAQDRNPVSTAYAPTIMTGSDQCLVALSAGGQAVGFGFSIGSAISDPICEALKLARQLHAFGYPAQALKLLKAADPRVADAFKE
jgi:hypothetical protein